MRAGIFVPNNITTIVDQKKIILAFAFYPEP
jgi:hypothetical protein